MKSRIINGGQRETGGAGHRLALGQEVRGRAQVEEGRVRVGSEGVGGGLEGVGRGV